MDHTSAHAGSSAAAAAAANTRSQPDSSTGSPPVSKRTSSRHAVRDTAAFVTGSPPSTPPNPRRRPPRKGKLPLRAHASNVEAKLRGPEVNGGSNGNSNSKDAAAASTSRHSHGLSWSSTTRDSVVDNLLLSLDNFSTPNVHYPDQPVENNYFETEKYRFPPGSQIGPIPRTAQRSRGHTYSSSLSSDFPLGESPVSTTTSQATKGRRSNSSSNFSNHHPFNSKVRLGQRVDGPQRTSSDTQRPVKSALSLTRAPEGRESSDTFDYSYGAARETSRLAFVRRSVSMDHIYSESQSQRASSILDRGRPVPSVYSKYESNLDVNACPEPGVPAGPRKLQNPTATGPVYVTQALPRGSALRKITTQSDLRSSVKPMPSPPIPVDIRNQASDFVRASSMRGMPSIPDLNDTNATPTPQPAKRRDAQSPPREKPGFFKRVFGGARANTAPVESHPPRTDSRQQMQNAVHATKSQSSMHDAVARPKSEVGQTSRDRPGTTASAHAPSTLNKKPSSFFRRRKKSQSEPVPALPSDISHLSANVRRAEPSPSASSLRKALGPFITKDEAGLNEVFRGKENERPNTSESSASEDLDIFHYGYTPPADASLDKLQAALREPPSSAARMNDSPRMKVKKRKPELVTTGSTTTLQQEHFLQQPQRAILAGPISPALTPPTDLSGGVSPVSATHPLEDDRPPSRASTGDRIIASRSFSLSGEREPRLEFAESGLFSRAVPDGEFVVTSSSRPGTKDRPDSKKSERLYLSPTPTASEEVLNSGLPPVDGSGSNSVVASAVSPYGQRSGVQSPAGTPSTRFHSAVSLPLVQVDGNDVPRESVETALVNEPAEILDDGAEYRERARKIFEGDEEDVTKPEAAAWLGERNTLSSRTLQAYLQLFDFAGRNILAALRTLCGNLVLRGESQQLDRIFKVLSARWCECNPCHGFKAEDVVHTIIYSLIMLNTDLHVADIENKMTRSGYVKNTLPTIKRVVTDAAPGAFDDHYRAGSSNSRPIMPWSSSNPSAPSSPALPPDTPVDRQSIDERRPGGTKRLSMRPGVLRSESEGWTPDSAGGSSSSNALVNCSWEGPMRGWECEVENVLKSFFSSIRSDPLPLHGFSMTDVTQSDRNLSVGNHGLKRSGSVVSKAPSDSMSHRSKPGLGSMAIRWPGRTNRSRPKFYTSSTVASSRTSFDDNNSMWSPAQSSTWGSKYSLGKTLTSTSMGSLGQHFSPTATDYKHSIGFANALSQAIIREESAAVASAGDSESNVSVPKNILEDETLALEGAPWAKEGLVKHKAHKGDTGAKAKDRNWDDCFAVISKGRLTLFAFNTATKSHSMGRNRNASKAGRAASMTAARVGGGDWMENAEQLENFVLRQTIASVLPPPGYSKTRPHVWALQLPSGAVHLFHVGTPEIATEFMSSANYWSARLSKEPLQGGVSNIEYGWSDQVIDMALLEQPVDNPHSSPPPSAQNRQHSHAHTSSNSTMPRPSTQSSIRASFDTGFGDRRARLPGDKVTLADWQPPTQSMMASQLMEVDQLRGLQAYVANVESELEKHNELKHGIELAFSPRHPNFGKAMINWQRKSEYLLKENVKFRTYADSLAAAQAAKDKFYAKRNEHMPQVGGGSSGSAQSGAAAAARQQHQQRPATTAGGSSGTSGNAVSVDPAVLKEWSDLTPRASHQMPSPQYQQV